MRVIYRNIRLALTDRHLSSSRRKKNGLHNFSNPVNNPNVQFFFLDSEDIKVPGAVPCFNLEWGTLYSASY